MGSRRQCIPASTELRGCWDIKTQWLPSLDLSPQLLSMGTYVRTYVRANSKVFFQSPTYVCTYMSTEAWYRKHFGNGVTYHCSVWSKVYTSSALSSVVSSQLKWLTLLSKVCTTSAFSNWPGLLTKWNINQSS